MIPPIKLHCTCTCKRKGHQRGNRFGWQTGVNAGHRHWRHLAFLQPDGCFLSEDSEGLEWELGVASWCPLTGLGVGYWDLISRQERYIDCLVCCSLKFLACILIKKIHLSGKKSGSTWMRVKSGLGYYKGNAVPLLSTQGNRKLLGQWRSFGSLANGKITNICN